MPGGLGNGRLLGLSQLDKVNAKNIPIDNVGISKVSFRFSRQVRQLLHKSESLKGLSIITWKTKVTGEFPAKFPTAEYPTRLRNNTSGSLIGCKKGRPTKSEMSGSDINKNPSLKPVTLALTNLKAFFFNGPFKFLSRPHTKLIPQKKIFFKHFNFLLLAGRSLTHLLSFTGVLPRCILTITSDALGGVGMQTVLSFALDCV